VAQTRVVKTGKLPLEMAENLTELVRTAWENGDFLEEVTPITRDLLKYWDPEGSFADLRSMNFHEGQWQAILNTIYLHEVLKVRNVIGIYQSVRKKLLEYGNEGGAGAINSILASLDIEELGNAKYSHPMYGVKMATGTGKTWVMHALLIWQYLNAKHEETPSGRFSKNFLLIAPGLIVYERLLDAYLGKVKEDGTRDFETSDIRRYADVFIPKAYREEVFGFVQSSVANKKEIGRKVTGEGMIAITNWHLLSENVEEESEEGLENPPGTVKKLLPITPGKNAGHALDQLDNAFLHGKELEFLSDLQDLVVFNDEAHHLAEMKKSDEIIQKRWQEALLRIAAIKGDRYMQVDFSATPYTVSGTGNRRKKHYFPHIIVDFGLKEAIWHGLVKTVAIDKRKEIAALPLDFTAERDGDLITLSDGQKVMLRAGLSKLRILEEGFISFDPNKHPKMLVMCEDTSVVPVVRDFLIQEGLSEEEVMEIHSNRKGEVTEQEWNAIKQRLFDMDHHKEPKVILSVLMLREGFDVNNICVIVPLRSAASSILLEQTIGRGLRLMWREPDFQDVKRETREKLLLKKEEPDNYLDILSIIEHPRFVEFYERELSGTLAETKELPRKERVMGDLISVGLKEGYEDYDLIWPIIIYDREEFLKAENLSLEELQPFPVKLEDLMGLVPSEGEVFYGEELTVKTRFGEYAVTSDIFTAKNYNSFLQKVVRTVSSIPVRVSKRKSKNFPVMQINTALVAELVDRYIRNRLFGESFDPLEGDNWRVLLLSQGKIIEHVVRNVSKVIYDLQNSRDISEAEVVKRRFSEIKELKMRENYSIPVAKSIYPRLPYPSNKGGFEKAFMEFVDADTGVKSFIKINEWAHDFASIIYIREDGLLANYHPDFLVRVDDTMYIVETKAQNNVNNPNVQHKRLATIDWVNKVNDLEPEDRMECEWKYVLLGEKTFYSMSDKGANTQEILEYAKMTKAKIKGTLSDYLGMKEY